MTTRENLIPPGLPYGGRSDAREALAAADQPNEATGLQPQLPLNAPPPQMQAALPGDLDMLAEATPPRGLMDRTEATLDPMNRLRQVRDTTPNQFLRAVLERLLDGP